MIPVSGSALAPPRLTRAEQQEVTRTRILDAADAVLTERGYSPATVEEIAARAGYTRGAVYSNFAGKDELALAIIERRIAAVSEMLVELAGTTGDRTQAAAAGTRFSQLLTADRPWAPLLLEFASHAARKPELASRLQNLYAGLAQNIADAIGGVATTQGIELPRPAERLAMVFLAATDGVAFERLIDPETVKPELLGEIVELIVLGLLSKAANEGADQ